MSGAGSTGGAPGVRGASRAGGSREAAEVVVGGVLSGVAQHVLQRAEQRQAEGRVDAVGVDRPPDLVRGQRLLGGAQVIADRDDEV